jgi:hypothetical protein
LVICHIESSVQISQFSFVSTVSLLWPQFFPVLGTKLDTKAASQR